MNVLELQQEVFKLQRELREMTHQRDLLLMKLICAEGVAEMRGQVLEVYRRARVTSAVAPGTPSAAP